MRLSIILFLASIYYAGVLFSFDAKGYDLNRPIGSVLKVDINRLEDFQYVASIIKKINDAIVKEPEKLDLFKLRNLYLYILWDIAPQDKKVAVSKIGMKAAEETIKKFPDFPDGWIYKAIFLGTYGISRGVLNSLQVARPMREAALKAYKLDKSYFYAMPPQILGRLYFKLPPFPMSFGNINRAAEYLYEAYSLCSDYAHTYMYLAELEATMGHLKRAEEWLDKLPQIQPKTWFEKIIKEWTMRTLPKARKLLHERLDRYNYDFLTDPLRHNR